MEVKNEKETRHLRDQRQRRAKNEELANLKADAESRDARQELAGFKEENMKLRRALKEQKDCQFI